ncbi:MAG TPA: hypothetical protein VK530_08135 [Candidatus Acidoferrum sp.]|nr:hypothetical protein [Candidatus Acidoferrum sp.]
MRVRKSWREKLADSKELPKVAKIEGKLSTRWGTGTMVVPAPTEVDDLMRCVPKGKLTTINELCGALAKKHGVNIARPITTEFSHGSRPMRRRKQRWRVQNGSRRNGAR